MRMERCQLDISMTGTEPSPGKLSLCYLSFEGLQRDFEPALHNLAGLHVYSSILCSSIPCPPDQTHGSTVPNELTCDSRCQE